MRLSAIRDTFFGMATAPHLPVAWNAQGRVVGIRPRSAPTNQGYSGPYLISAPNGRGSIHAGVVVLRRSVKENAEVAELRGVLLSEREEESRRRVP